MTNRKKSEEEEDHWIQRRWRPMMAWCYGVICLWDFFLAPIFFAWYAYFTKTPLTLWIPLTTQGGGLFHLSMGAIVGVSSFSKSQERISVSNNSGYQQSGFNQFQQSGQFNQQSADIQTTSFVAASPVSTQNTPTTKPHVVIPPSDPDPEL